MYTALSGVELMACCVVWGVLGLSARCFLPDLFEGRAGICGGSVVGNVPPALPDDPDSPSSSPSVDG